VPTAAVETTATVEAPTDSAAVKSAAGSVRGAESVRTESPIEVAEALLAHLSGLM